MNECLHVLMVVCLIVGSVINRPVIVIVSLLGVRIPLIA